MMNTDILEGKWTQLKGKVKEHWGKLTDDDMSLMSGKKDQIIGKLQERYGWSKEESEQQYSDFCVKHHDHSDHN